MSAALIEGCCDLHLMVPDMKIPLYHVDAFSERVFSGNPAAVCPLQAWLPDHIMQAIAAENNLSETAFFIPHGDRFDLRWFTPATEVNLCGHATLAAAFVILNHSPSTNTTVHFLTKSGPLHVCREGGILVMDLPSRPAESCAFPQELLEALGHVPEEMLVSQAYLAVYGREDEVADLQPNLARLAASVSRTVIVTAPGIRVDFVSRYFAPSIGVPEDPVTGSAHCTLIPYWSKRLGKKTLVAHQLSRRGGELLCEDRSGRVRIGGRAVLYLEGAISFTP